MTSEMIESDWLSIRYLLRQRDSEIRKMARRLEHSHLKI